MTSLDQCGSATPTTIAVMKIGSRRSTVSTSRTAVANKKRQLGVFVFQRRRPTAAPAIMYHVA
jgi:hypothetical protein